MKISEIVSRRKQGLVILLNLVLVGFYFAWMFFSEKRIEGFYYVNATSYVLSISNSLTILILVIMSFVLLSEKSRVTKIVFFPLILFWGYVFGIHIYSTSGEGNNVISYVSFTAVGIASFFIIGAIYDLFFRKRTLQAIRQMEADNEQLQKDNREMKIRLQKAYGTRIANTFIGYDAKYAELEAHFERIENCQSLSEVKGKVMAARIYHHAEGRQVHRLVKQLSELVTPSRSGQAISDQ